MIHKQRDNFIPSLVVFKVVEEEEEESSLERQNFITHFPTTLSQPTNLLIEIRSLIKMISYWSHLIEEDPDLYYIEECILEGKIDLNAASLEDYIAKTNKSMGVSEQSWRSKLATHADWVETNFEISPTKNLTITYSEDRGFTFYTG